MSDEKVCPLMKSPMGKPQPCIKEHCMWYIKVNGTEKNTGQELVNKGGCAMSWVPILLIENSQLVREQGAATESLRNRVSETREDTDRVVGCVNSLVKDSRDKMQILENVTKGFGEALVKVSQSERSRIEQNLDDGNSNIPN